MITIVPKSKNKKLTDISDERRYNQVIKNGHFRYLFDFVDS